MSRAPQPADILPPQLARHVAVDPDTGCWLWQGAVSRSNGRPKCSLTIHGHRETLPYRAALRHVVGDPLPGMVACHVCNQKLCIRPDIRRHVRWATPGDNAADVRRSGTHAGERHAHRLTEADVRTIRRDCRAAGGRTPTRALAQRYGVSAHAVYEAAVGRTWRHLTREDAHVG